jgi:RTX calcium-binding nonapeptide repeat (4 copies)
MLTIEGTGKPDQLKGSPTDEQILGLGGNDLLDGGGGLDDLFGGEGNDKFLANSTSAEDFDGGAGKDTVDYSKVLARVCGLWAYIVPCYSVKQRQESSSMWACRCRCGHTIADS